MRDAAKLREFLLETGRFEVVGAGNEALRAAGVAYTWWLGPGEPVALESGGAWPCGGFVFLYREGSEELDCFLSAGEAEACTESKGGEDAMAGSMVGKENVVN